MTTPHKEINSRKASETCAAIRAAANAAEQKRLEQQIARENALIWRLFGDHAPAVIETRKDRGYYSLCGRSLRVWNNGVWGQSGHHGDFMQHGYELIGMAAVARWLDVCDEYDRAKAAIPPPPQSIAEPVIATEDDTGLLRWVKKFFA